MSQWTPGFPDFGPEQRGIDAVIFGIGGEGLHGPAEFADLTTIVPYYQALRSFLHGLR